VVAALEFVVFGCAGTDAIDLVARTRRADAGDRAGDLAVGVAVVRRLTRQRALA
jgi:hypothetical protein